MSVLPAEEIKKLVAEKKLIEFFDPKSRLQPASYDMKISSIIKWDERKKKFIEKRFEKEDIILEISNIELFEEIIGTKEKEKTIEDLSKKIKDMENQLRKHKPIFERIDKMIEGYGKRKRKNR